MELGLTEAIDSLVIAPHGDAVVEVAQQHSTLSAKLALALAELDRRREYEIRGLRVDDGVVPRQARLDEPDRQPDAQARPSAARPAGHPGRVGGRGLTDGQVEIIVACVTDRRAALWSEHEAEIVPLLGPWMCIQTNRAMQDWAAKADAILDEKDPPRSPSAEAMLMKTLDGRGYLKGSLRRRGHRDHRHRTAPR